jgi:hypothetical protein
MDKDDQEFKLKLKATFVREEFPIFRPASNVFKAQFFEKFNTNTKSNR